MASSDNMKRDEPATAEFVVMNECQMRADLSYYLGQLWRFGIVLSRSDAVAQKLVEQTCIRALKREPLQFCTNRTDCWLFSIEHSVWFNDYRPDGDGGGCSPYTGTALLPQVMGLPDAHRAAVFLAYVEGLSYREVSEVLSLPVSGVMKNLTAARILLAQIPSQSSPERAGVSTDKGEHQ
ncbi:sigma factor-like helix-turn-helix DNA-binding protein [Phyllobacterium endophyticum]|uniref:sigma factor-like helix-turn-helix DNA-binding protein n=1 Tax=Phyllobacterium endophyticum TaxID=1149773 RepID=UPI0011C97F78|nr:sigma factor-like helix-turn-helix DNA-binding protein [Phyllobacterium endophyticum]TXR46498.1 RNA polymerase sigma factor [Phyllobacterium endophyticum]